MARPKQRMTMITGRGYERIGFGRGLQHSIAGEDSGLQQMTPGGELRPVTTRRNLGTNHREVSDSTGDQAVTDVKELSTVATDADLQQFTAGAGRPVTAWRNYATGDQAVAAVRNLSLDPQQVRTPHYNAIRSLSPGSARRRPHPLRGNKISHGESCKCRECLPTKVRGPYGVENHGEACGCDVCLLPTYFPGRGMNYRCIEHYEADEFWRLQELAWEQIGLPNGGGEGDVWYRFYVKKYKGVYLVISTKDYPSYPNYPGWKIKETWEMVLKSTREFCVEHGIMVPAWFHLPRVVKNATYPRNQPQRCIWACSVDHHPIIGCPSCDAHREHGQLTLVECFQCEYDLPPRVCFACWDRLHEGKPPWWNDFDPFPIDFRTGRVYPRRNQPK